MKRIEFLDCPMDVATMAETVDIVSDRIRKKQFTQHVVVNVAKLVNMRRDSQLRESVAACDIINIDGMGVVFGGRFLGHDISERVAGVDLFLALLARSAELGFPVFLLGAEESVVKKVAADVQEIYSDLDVAGFHHGYFWNDEEEIVRKIGKSGARLLFVAITSPKKENFINRWKSELNVDFVMGVGGSFDVVAGKVRRAPVWMQRAGLEWFYRLLQEPLRMTRRYFVTNSEFAWLLLRQKFRDWRIKRGGG